MRNGLVASETQTRGDVEREMSGYQRGMVNTCFEEGQYDAGIAVLDQLRSPKYTPSPSHIRQLLFIVLYSSPPPDKRERGGASSAPGPPSKMAKQQQKSIFIPTSETRDAAIRLLISFSITNTPGALLRALPRYPDAADDSNGTADLGDDDEDSPIGKEATRLRDGKGCWNALKSGFIKRKDLAMLVASPTKKGKRPRQDSFEEDIFNLSENVETPAVISNNAWPVLDWLIVLFEKDEALTEDAGLPRYSPLLLCQIPSSRNGPRWEVDTPLDIIFYCLEQSDQRRRAMGIRLFVSLINLTSTIYFDKFTFMAAVLTRLSAFSSEQFHDVFSELPPSPTISQFKVALFSKYITSQSSEGVGQSAPVIRAQPRTVRPVGRNASSSSLGKQSKGPTSGPTISSISSRYPSTSSTDIFLLLQKHLGRDCKVDVRCKFELLIAYNSLPSEDKDQNWRSLVTDGNQLGELLEKCFGVGNEATMYKGLLKAILNAD